MGREAAITLEQVYAVADAMRAEGVKPTSRAVRERLGNTGSMGTVNKLLQRWKATQEREQAAALSLPPALQRAILDFMDTELAAARAALETQLVEQQQEAADLAAENERQADAVEDQRQALERVATEKASAEGRAQQLAADLDGAKGEAGRERQAAESARTELAKALLRLEAMPRLEGDLEAVRAELAKERQARVEAEKRAAVLGAQKADLDARLIALQDQAKASAAELLAERKRLETSRDEAAKAREDAAKLRGQVEAVVAELEGERKRLEPSRAEKKVS
jgi:chromosome segregation ATPase